MSDTLWRVSHTCIVRRLKDGCYHCSHAHQDLASNIDESNYATRILSPELSIQHAPPSSNGEDVARFGSDRAAVYAQWYPNVMFNRYGPWLDVDIIKPVDATSCIVQKAWYLETNYASSDATISREDYIATSLASSERVHDEDVFLCENVQRGMLARHVGFDRGRYVPSKQIAAFSFHQRLAADLRGDATTAS